MEKLEIRVFLRHYWRQGLKGTEAVKKICEVEGPDVVSIHTVPKLFNIVFFPRNGQESNVMCLVEF